MSEVTSSIDPSAYWTAADRVRELRAVPAYDVTDAHCEEFHSNIATIDNLRSEARSGQTTGTPILDRLIASGQIMSQDDLEQHDVTEQMLTADSPMLLQLGFLWRVGIIADEKVWFSPVNRDSHFGPMANGYQAIPVRSYVELQLDPGIGSLGYDAFNRMDVRNVQQGSYPHEAGYGIGMPLTAEALGRHSFRGKTRAPQGLVEAWKSYQNANESIDKDGTRRFTSGLYVGREAVEACSGMELGELAEIANNDDLLEYATRPD